MTTIASVVCAAWDSKALIQWAPLKVLSLASSRLISCSFGRIQFWQVWWDTLLKCDVLRASHMCAIRRERVILYRMCYTKYHGAQPGSLLSNSRLFSIVPQRLNHGCLLHHECFLLCPIKSCLMLCTWITVMVLQGSLGCFVQHWVQIFNDSLSCFVWQWLRYLVGQAMHVFECSALSATQ